jgi:N-acetyl-anhydromuramyl-L-alanine amidase AmpD
MAKHRTRVGLHARNTVHFPEADYALVREARIETLKMMSHTDVTVFQRLRQENPGIEFIVRLYDDRLRNDSRPSPAAFATKMVPLINSLQPYTDKFEIHNEPNHVEGIEGWGASDQDARNFCSWYMQVLTVLRQQCPWAKFGFPGLAMPDFLHHDLAWLDICRDAVEASDWLGCHCYWQYGNMLRDKWGLLFKLYHERFPDKPIEITEFGNSTPPKELPREEMARQYTRFYKELNQYPYLGSASSFIASSPDPAWVPFVWMKEGGERLPIVTAVRNMDRTPVEIPPEPVPAPEPQPPTPAPGPTQRTFPETGKTVRGAFLQFFERYGLDLCGYPITDQFMEFGLPAQYFQRLALEEFKPGQIRLKLAGTDAWTLRDRVTQLEARVKELTERPPSGGGPTQPPMEDISAKLPTHATKRYPTRPLSDITQIVIHHTATSPTITAQRLAQYQVRNLDKPGIVYHFFIAGDGKIYQTNKLETVSDHAYSRNQESIGVCFAGNFTNDIPTSLQIQAGGQLCAWLLGLLRLPTSKIVGLGEFVNTQSPGKQWLGGQKWKNKLLAEVEADLETGGEDQSAIIASLREQIEAMQAEIDRLKEAPPAPTPAPTPAPAPGPAKITPPAIQDLIDKLPRHATKKYNSRKLSDIQTLVIHHSAVVPSVGPKRIAEYHVNKEDWPGIGYHYLVGDDGIVYQGNALTTVSYHAASVNPRGVGICFLGSFQTEVPPPAQLKSGAQLVAWLLQELKLDLDVVKGHQEFMQTACPGNQWLKGKKWKQLLRQEIARVQEGAKPAPEPAPSGAKPIYHYVLFWTRNGTWAEKDWLNAQGYIGRFHPSVGFRVNDAAQAEYVTIVGGPLGTPKSAEDWLKEQGCRVDRIAGKDEADTKRMLDELADQGKRFLGFDEE